MATKKSFEKATKTTASAGKTAGFKRGAEMAALNLSALLKEHGAHIGADVVENDR